MVAYTDGRSKDSDVEYHQRQEHLNLQQHSDELQPSSKQLMKVLRRNERERRRVHKVNLGFELLSKKIPGGSRKKLSKAETLRQALLYIKYLQQILHENDDRQFCTPDVMSMQNQVVAPEYHQHYTGAQFPLDFQFNDCKPY